ncbi:tRNA (adenosine(37)-N6)-dimethylallyltransferase MiaA [Dyadobacter aurulentus]|uniref:tRNA (adenosine(37)-N6)-dimethylallyltransferase MiaA n=1 Tax=Dyadobacter sp. UC 10 TaxID=2605428 RepID=UPI0011F32F4E|nr:tRNA (adenosine(37)-N6)-dimethylallyltransferase MiaA [Dyadobacter sp. UC 10]KAA0991470.1 tRNA (adenosine(37)-N6)-dimethylallyltransferase MiaA [Dyadobacter sp. UC 10]
MPNSKKKKLIIIAGPTAVGKTAISIKLAKDLNSEIISADSRQFFRELNIGTAKPSSQELNEVHHHYINSHSIIENYSAGDFERDVIALLETVFETADHIVMTGGSGFYIKAVLEGLDDLPVPLPGLRESLTERLHTEGLHVLQQELETIDPAFHNSSEILNPQRVLRALEVYKTTGTPISQFRLRNKKERNFEPVCIAVNRERAELYQRIDTRIDSMLADGLVDEVRGLSGFRTHQALQTVGYKEVFDFLDGTYDEQEMIRILKQNSRRYAKRQLTWFRHQGNFEWFDVEDYEKILGHIRARLLV